QAEDCIRDRNVTGVQTCALPISDGTIYLYFKNKEDILISVFKEKMGSFIKYIDDKIKVEDTAEKQLLALIETHFSQLSENKYLAIVTQLELRQSKPK